jgi:hypothetical protein
MAPAGTSVAIGPSATASAITNGVSIGQSSSLVSAAYSLGFGINASSINPGTLGLTLNGTAYQTPIYSSFYATTATAAGTTVLTVSSAKTQYFTGTTYQAVTLPVTSTLATGFTFTIVNNSTDGITVNSSGGQSVSFVQPGTSNDISCVLASGTTAASWSGGNVKIAATTGADMYHICFDGTNVWINNPDLNSVTKILASTGAVIGTYATGASPHSI